VKFFTKPAILMGGTWRDECTVWRVTLLARRSLGHTGGMPRKSRAFPFGRSYTFLENNVARSGSVIAASYTLVGSILLLGGAGYLVDRWRGTAPWFLLGGLLLGMVVGFYELAKTVYRR